MPSKRNAIKFGRDFVVAFVNFAALWVAGNYTTLELSPEVVAVTTPVALLIYRQIRKALGMDPAVG